MLNAKIGTPDSVEAQIQEQMKKCADRRGEIIPVRRRISAGP